MRGLVWFASVVAWAVLVGPPLLLLMITAGGHHRKIRWIWVIRPEVCHAICRRRAIQILSFVVILLLVMLVHRGVLLAHTVAVILGRWALVLHRVLAFDQGILVMTFVLLVLVKAALWTIGFATSTDESSINFIGCASDTFLRHLITRIAVRWLHKGGLTPVLLIPGTRDLTAIAIAHLTALWILVRLVILLLLVLVLVRLLLLSATIMLTNWPAFAIFRIQFLFAGDNSVNLRGGWVCLLVQTVHIPAPRTHFLGRRLWWVYFTAGVICTGLPTWLMLHNVHVHHISILLLVNFFLWNCCCWCRSRCNCLYEINKLG